jgi:hypothetical protein
MALNLHFASQRSAADRADDFEQRISAIADSVAGRFARGNVTLQQGYVVTREQLDEERAELRDYSSNR